MTVARCRRSRRFRGTWTRQTFSRRRGAETGGDWIPACAGMTAASPDACRRPDSSATIVYMATIEAIYENGVFKPVEPVTLADQQRVQIDVRPIPQPTTRT